MASPAEITAGAKRICGLVAGSRPFFIGRNGTIEMEALYYYLAVRAAGTNDRPYPDRILEQLQRNAGIFPSTSEAIDAWAAEYLTHLGSLDGLAAGWYAPLRMIETMVLDRFAPQAFRIPLRSLEPYYVPPAQQWTRQLAEKRVCVVSSFTGTIRRQLYGETVGGIWTGEREGLITEPGIEWSFVRTGYAPTLGLGHGEWPAGITDWKGAVEHTVAAVQATGAQIAIIGCGGLGMIVAGRLRALGISAIVIGGAVQVLFGICGKRWASHDVISKFWNSYWVWPSPEEIPGGAHFVEGGCYWK